MRRHALSLFALVAATATATAQAQELTVRVQPGPTVAGAVQLSFSAPALPNGGYYYGVVVLKPYRSYTGTLPPACSTSSNMQHTAYGHPQPDGLVTLALAPKESDTNRWCRGGHYDGAIYAVPQERPCAGRYPCRSEPYEPKPCWDREGHILCGVVAEPVWRYPDPLPAPLAKGTKIVAHFSVSFAAKVLRVLHLAATVYNVTETLDGTVSSHESLSAGGRHRGQDFSTCVPEPGPTIFHCTGKYTLPGGTLRFAGTIAKGAATRLTILGGSGRYRRAEGTVLTEYDARGGHARETITLEQRDGVQKPATMKPAATSR